MESNFYQFIKDRDMPQRLYCSECGGNLNSYVQSCPHCGRGLRGITSGTQEDQSRTKKQHSQQLANARQRQRRKDWEPLFGILEHLQKVLRLLALDVFITALIVGGIIFFYGVLGHYLQNIVAGKPHASLRAAVACVSVLATVLASFSVFIVVPPWYWSPWSDFWETKMYKSDTIRGELEGLSYRLRWMKGGGPFSWLFEILAVLSNICNRLFENIWHRTRHNFKVFLIVQASIWVMGGGVFVFVILWMK